MAWTRQHIADLDEAIATGLTSFQYSDGSRGAYRDIPEMFEIRERMEAAVKKAENPGLKTYRAVRVTPRSGY